MGTGVADSTLDVVGSYQSVLIAHWVAAPWHAILQSLAVLTVWTHACIGIHFWLRPKPATRSGGPICSFSPCCCRRSRSPATSPPATRWCARAADPDFVPHVLREAT